MGRHLQETTRSFASARAVARRSAQFVDVSATQRNAGAIRSQAPPGGCPNPECARCPVRQSGRSTRPCEPWRPIQFKTPVSNVLIDVLGIVHDPASKDDARERGHQVLVQVHDLRLPVREHPGTGLAGARSVAGHTRQGATAGSGRR